MQNTKQHSIDFERLKTDLFQKVETCLNLAEKSYGRKFVYHCIEINIRGKTAGQVRYRRFPKNVTTDIELRFNPVLLAKYGQQFINEVVPHECAHLVVYSLFQHRKSLRPKPHGLEWKNVMIDVYGLEPRVTHQYEVEGSKRDKYIYQCDCKDVLHRLGIIRHNKVMRKQSGYRCRACSESLVYQGKKEVWV